MMIISMLEMQKLRHRKVQLQNKDSSPDSKAGFMLAWSEVKLGHQKSSFSPKLRSPVCVWVTLTQCKHLNQSLCLISESITLAGNGTCWSAKNNQGPSPELRVKWGNQPHSQDAVLWEERWMGSGYHKGAEEINKNATLLLKTWWAQRA